MHNMKTNMQLRQDGDHTRWGVDQREKDIRLGSLSRFNQDKEKTMSVKTRLDSGVRLGNINRVGTD
jgi:hypothetical protein